ncbi:hypothetical protein [Legionella hackeliae]|uniref:Uncharacterized protein n=1 Tax=Legionella hackeliae TaxID=449 RepID=A0A0A8UM83_LEGHA|nr:hypothetical protein [Legionella hackeliae]KTD10476.1 hypothetical protein Lhac_2844 [Legionella hackeliae]CEK09980.1 protein of unknown function [Legionella hackeliae]STX49892.1 Uncharacterised protein [Legionella hackeliae]
MTKRKAPTPEISKGKQKISPRNLRKISGGKDKSYIDIHNPIKTPTAPAAGT